MERLLSSNLLIILFLFLIFEFDLGTFYENIERTILLDYLNIENLKNNLQSYFLYNTLKFINVKFVNMLFLFCDLNSLKIYTTNY